MWCFAHIDRLSAYWNGDPSPRGQAKRMVDFISTYMKQDRLAASIAVEIWRHKLMHISEPRKVVDPQTGKSCHWLLHWGDWLRRDQHFVVEDSGAQLKLYMALFYLIDDLKQAQDDYLEDLCKNPSLQANFQRAETDLNSGQLRRY